MTINNKTLTTVENLVTSPTTTEGNFRIGVGDALIELNNLNENASDGINCSTEYIYPGDFTWIAPSNVKIMVQCAGGGGGGGATAEDDTSNQRAIASGGSGGGYSRIIMDVTTGTQIDLTVGAGGNAASASSASTRAASGGNGSASTVTIPVIGSSDIVLTANGGGGGRAVETNTSSNLTFATSVGGTASGGTVNNQGISSPPATTGSSVSSLNFLMFPPGSFTSGFDNSIAITETQARSRTTAAPVQFVYTGSNVSASVEFNKESKFGKALNSSISGIAGTGDLTVSQSSGAGFANNSILLQSAHATGGAPAMAQCGDNDTGPKTASSGAGGDGFVIITVLNI